MKSALAALIVLAGVSLLMASQKLGGQTPAWNLPSFEKEVMAVHDQMRQAAEKLDADALYAHVLDSRAYPIIESGQLRATREQALESTRRGFEGITKLSYTYTRKQVVMLSTSSAVWIGQGTSSATLVDGRRISTDFAETVVFVSNEGKWKVLHAHRSAPNAR